VLIAEDLPNPTNLGHEARRVLFTKSAQPATAS